MRENFYHEWTQTNTNKKIPNNKFLFLIWLVFSISITSVSYAQSYEISLKPQQIFVGDFATLILEFPAEEQNNNQTGVGDIILTPQSGFMPSDPDIDFHRIKLERSVTGKKLLIEFSAFIPGKIELPVIEIGGENFAGITITVSSVIDEHSSHVLSGAATALAIPGTSLMLYGTLVIIIFLIIIMLLFFTKGRSFIKKLIQKWKFIRLFNSMRKIEKQLRREILKDIEKRVILDKLSDEFRIFLSNLIGINCRVKTAHEFERLDFTNSTFKNTVHINLVCTTTLPTFFRTLDNIRFSGDTIDSQNINKLLDDLNSFLTAFENADKNEKDKNEKKEEKHEHPL